MNLQPVCLGEAHVREHLVLGRVHEHAELREAFPELISDRAPLSTGVCLALLGENGADERGHHLTVALGDVDDGVPHEVDATSPFGSRTALHDAYPAISSTHLVP